MWLCMMCFMCCCGALSYCIVTSVDHKDPSKGTGDLEQHSCCASAARLMVLACWSIIGKVLSCISLMHDTGANSWVASVKLFCLALSPLRLSSTRRDYRLWFWKKKITSLILPGTETQFICSCDSRDTGRGLFLTSWLYCHWHKDTLSTC